VYRFAEAFVQNTDGSWFCRAPAHFLGRNGPHTTTPGVTYRRGRPTQGYDIAEWLDNWTKSGHPPVGIEFFGST
jgi:hypothetical protein